MKQSIWDMSECVSLPSVLSPQVFSSFLRMNVSQSGSRSQVRTRLCSQVWRHFLWPLYAEPWPSVGSWAARHPQTPPSDPGTCTHTRQRLNEILKWRTWGFQVLILLLEQNFHFAPACFWGQALGVGLTYSWTGPGCSRDRKSAGHTSCPTGCRWYRWHSRTTPDRVRTLHTDSHSAIESSYGRWKWGSGTTFPSSHHFWNGTSLIYLVVYN